MAQSRIYEEEEESKHISSQENEVQSRGDGQSEDISTDSDEDDDDEDILIKPKDLIVSQKFILSSIFLSHLIDLPRW